MGSEISVGGALRGSRQTTVLTKERLQGGGVRVQVVHQEGEVGSAVLGGEVLRNTGIDHHL